MAFSVPVPFTSFRSCRHDPDGSLSPPCLVCFRKDRTPVQGPVSDNELYPVPPTTVLPEAASEEELSSSDQKLAPGLSVSTSPQLYARVAQALFPIFSMRRLNNTQAAATDLLLGSPQVHFSYSNQYYCPQRSTIEEGGGTPQQITASTLQEYLDRNPPAGDRMTSPGRAGVSPSSSPRLPSPPPFTEVQFGPKSPTVGDVPEYPFSSAAKSNDGPTRRIRPGTKAAAMARGPPLVPLSEVCLLFKLKIIHLSDPCGARLSIPATRAPESSLLLLHAESQSQHHHTNHT